MSTDEPNSPRRDIATSSLRALRAARGAPPPEATDETAVVEPAVEPAAEPIDETAVEATVEEPVAENDETAAEAAADSDDTADTDAAVDADDDAADDAADDADDDDDGIGTAETSDTEVAVDTDDEPPVLASAPPRRSKRTSSRTTTEVSPDREPRRPSRLTAVSSAVAAAALVFGVVAGIVWWRADHDPQRTAAITRDEVAVDARLAIATVNTSDYRKPADALSNWLAVSAGSLKSQFTDQRKAATTLLGQSKVITSAIVLDAAVTKLDTAKGSATVIASVNLKRKPITGAATTTRNRFRATLTKQGDDWKLADLVLVPVQLT